MSEALRALLRQAPGAGELSGPDVRVGRATHPVCGDEVELFLRVQQDTVVDLAWRARGCPACVAVAAAAKQALVGAPLDAASGNLARVVQSLGGLAATERHALKLIDDALRAAR